MKMLLQIPIIFIQMLFVLTAAVLLTLPIYVMAQLYYFIKESFDPNMNDSGIYPEWSGGEGAESSEEMAASK